MTKKTIIRVVKRPGEFVTIHKAFLSDARLGIDAMGLLAWMLAKPDDWKQHIGHIAASTGSALNRVRSSMTKLVDCGYVRRQRITSRKTGQVIRWETIVFETPQAAEKAEQEQPLLFEKLDGPSMGRKKGQKNQKPHSERMEPDVENPQGGFPENGYPLDGYPEGGECTLLKTNVTNNESTKQRRTDGEVLPAADRLPASAGGSVGPVATAEPSSPASASGDRGPVVVDSEEQIVTSLVTKVPFPLKEARFLVQQHGLEACARGLACLAAASKPPDNRRGFVVKAIKEDWEPASGRAMPLARPMPVPPPAAVPGDGEAAAWQAERDAIDRELRLLTQDEWDRHLGELRPTLGPTLRQLLSNGRDPRSIQSIRRLVFERLHGAARKAAG